ncbi:hypothetical protein [Accumulibacter sp.]|jgi:hypothetical protein|uniref:hypothetical protein n=1 Tax=Candidatus Accumulibacter TaxID=327159 RepID=UPI0002E9F2DC|nr:hypothetical protein [Accumulibacter sp.]MBN8496536.1 hypothetical protein [Accumulibacter sp.]MBO3715418.1 hypothetical protein [Accumulibacter sp.]
MTIHVGDVALRERNAILAEYSPEPTGASVQYELLRRTAPYLTPAVDAPDAAFSVVLFGKDVRPPPRCFLAWPPLWADKVNEGALRQKLPVDGHPRGVYRMAAPSPHDKAFYEAFAIRAGDRMWLDPNDR